MSQQAIIDLRAAPYIQISAGSFKLRLYETVKRLSDTRANILNDLKDSLKSGVDPLEDAVLLMYMSKSGLPLVGVPAAQEDLLNRAVSLTQRIQYISTFANSYGSMPDSNVIQLTLQQAEDLGL